MENLRLMTDSAFSMNSRLKLMSLCIDKWLYCVVDKLTE